MAKAFELISSVTVGAGGAASVGFSSIPSTYTDLLVYLSFRDDNVNLFMTFNGSTANFTNKQLAYDGGGPASYSRTDTFVGYGQTASTFTANVFSNCSVYIPNYASSNNKSFSIDSASETNATGSAMLGLVGGLWSNTAAINAISFSASEVQYSTAYLYGIKKS
jgi:hypothetical protein